MNHALQGRDRYQSRQGNPRIAASGPGAGHRQAEALADRPRPPGCVKLSAYIQNSDDLDQAIREVAILRDRIYLWINSDEGPGEEERDWNRQIWDGLLARLKQLKDEPDAEADFG